MAITLFRIVPHSADIEWLFSNLGGIQSVKRCNLSVEMMQELGQLHAHYTHYLHEWNRQAGKPIRRKHGHMHTKTAPGINQGLVDKLSEGVVPAPEDVPSNTSSDECEDDITEDELQREFDKISDSMAGFVGVDLYRGGAIEAGKSYD
jgi:hypothetical protein